MSSDGRSLLAPSSYMYCGFNSVGACPVIIDMPLGCKKNAPAFWTMGFVIVDGRLVHKYECCILCICVH